MRAAAPAGVEASVTAALLETERVLASVIEAVIGACYLNAGYERTAAAVVEAFEPEIEQALEHPLDFKSALQELLARRGAEVSYEVTGEDGPPHDRTFAVRRAKVGRADAGQRQRPQQEARRAGGRARGRRRRLELGRSARGSARTARDAARVTMRLKSLTLKGFKSFPDRTHLDFGPGVSVVVGPNGSGKSNVTDAVLWAMGEQSPLAVRGQSMQDVIFGGGRGVQARSAAEVEIVLDNSDGTVDLPLSEISIVRRLDRAGEGGYRLNGARCRLTDVIEVLSDTGLGKETHSVVSQGRVEAIVTSKPRDRRLLIEEAAGLGKHRKRRRRAQLKLEKTQENLDRALDVEREARTRLRPLKRQAEAAELHERLERQMLEARWELAREALRARAAWSWRERRPRSSRRATRASEIEARLQAVDRAARRGRAGARPSGPSATTRWPDASTTRAPRASGWVARGAGRRERAGAGAADRAGGDGAAELGRRALSETGAGTRRGAEATAPSTAPAMAAGQARASSGSRALEGELAEIEREREREIEREIEGLETEREREVARVAELEQALEQARAARDAGRRAGRAGAREAAGGRARGAGHAPRGRAGGRRAGGGKPVPAQPRGASAAAARSARREGAERGAERARRVRAGAGRRARRALERGARARPGRGPGAARPRGPDGGSALLAELGSLARGSLPAMPAVEPPVAGRSGCWSW